MTGNRDDYVEFLRSKAPVTDAAGIDCDDLPAFLFDYQRRVVREALRVGRFAIFADTGLGKTAMQLAWAACLIESRAVRRVLLIAPLAVSEQTLREAAKFGIDVSAIDVINYESLHKFDPADYDAVVLDESSILKGMQSKVRQSIGVFCQSMRFILSCTATPSPNDFMEIGTQSEFLRVMSQDVMLAMYFTHDSSRTSKWRLKMHSEGIFYDWMSTWSCGIQRPSDVGGDDAEHELPPLRVERSVVGTSDPQGINPESLGLQARNRIRADSTVERCNRCADIARDLIDRGQNVLIWCYRNSESDLLQSLLPGSVAIKGSDSREHKATSLNRFAQGEIACLITKPSIAGFGMNFQYSCRDAIFVGLSDSFEQYYQALRRIWRYGQTQPVTAYVVSHVDEGAVIDNINRKSDESQRMMRELCKRSIRLVEAA